MRMPGGKLQVEKVWAPLTIPRDQPSHQIGVWLTDELTGIIGARDARASRKLL